MNSRAKSTLGWIVIIGFFAAATIFLVWSDVPKDFGDRSVIVFVAIVLFFCIPLGIKYGTQENKFWT